MASTKRRGSVQTNVHKSSRLAKIKHNTKLKSLNRKGNLNGGTAGNKGV